MTPAETVYHGGVVGILLMTRRTAGFFPPAVTTHYAGKPIVSLSTYSDSALITGCKMVSFYDFPVDSFFKMLQVELAFYIGCLNLYEQLNRLGAPVCFPLPAPLNERTHSFEGLYDACLALTMKQKIVGNDLKADLKDFVIITGANQGGKSTFLRSIGLAQLMMQSGMFTPAKSFCANVCDGLFTHYKREEDVTMTSGKLDEELGRMSFIADNITPNSIILFNE